MTANSSTKSVDQRNGKSYESFNNIANDFPLQVTVSRLQYNCNCTGLLLSVNKIYFKIGFTIRIYCTLSDCCVLHYYCCCCCCCCCSRPVNNYTWRYLQNGVADARIPQWLERWAANIQVVCSNPADARIRRISFCSWREENREYQLVSMWTPCTSGPDDVRAFYFSPSRLRIWHPVPQ